MAEAVLSKMEAIADRIQPPIQIQRATEIPNQEQDEPDPDAIKMFVGQIPKVWGEEELRSMFEQYGRVFQVTVLRDKATGQSRGCCFVTFFTRRAALEAQNALHNIKTLPGLHNPVQMKPAESEKKSDRKLFIGMLSRDFSEEDVRGLFAPYGAIEECAILRDSNNQSKGCAFVTYVSRQCALNAIKGLNNSHSIQGSRGPLQVKFADTPLEKEQKKRQQQQMAILQGYPYSHIGTLASTPLIQLQPYLWNHPGGLTYNWLPYSGSSNNLNLSALTLQQLLAANSGLASSATPLVSPSSPVSLNSNVLQSLLGVSTSSGNSNSSIPSPSNMATGSFATYSPLSSLNGYGAATTPSAYFSATGAQYPGFVPLTKRGVITDRLQLSDLATERTTQKVGPEGANLFIYHLPPEFEDADLIQMFSPFGRVVSAKVYIDLKTNRSKCFGFVSYDDPLAAQKAIQNMNGFQINEKRLKVQLKKTKDRPY